MSRLRTTGLCERRRSTGIVFLRLFEERYLVDLVPIPLRGNKVIIGMDWLSPNGAVIDCAQQSV